MNSSGVMTQLLALTVSERLGRLFGGRGLDKHVWCPSSTLNIVRKNLLIKLSDNNTCFHRTIFQLKQVCIEENYQGTCKVRRQIPSEGMITLIYFIITIGFSLMKD